MGRLAARIQWLLGYSNWPWLAPSRTETASPWGSNIITLSLRKNIIRAQRALFYTGDEQRWVDRWVWNDVVTALEVEFFARGVGGVAFEWSGEPVSGTATGILLVEPRDAAPLLIHSPLTGKPRSLEDVEFFALVCLVLVGSSLARRVWRPVDWFSWRR